MSVWQLILKEIRLRKMGFGLGVLSLLAAVGVLTAQLTMLRAHDLQTQRILDAKLEQTRQTAAQNQDAYRQIMKKLGFNLLILPEGQKLADFYAEGYAAKEMPEQYVATLAESKLASIKHILPSLEQRIRWPEQGQRAISLIGTRGEIAQGKQLPASELMMDPVAKDTAILGYEVADSLQLKPGSMITLLGKSFKVARCNTERGTKDDVTIWINLEQAQEMLGKPQRINSILALQCLCERSSLANIREDVAKILPGVQVFLTEDKVTTREQARKQAEALAVKELEAEKDHRARMRQEREAFAAWLIPLVTLGSTLWVGLLILVNVRERRAEIGLWRAVGFSSRRILFIFLGKSLLLGLLGALAGYGIGFSLGLLSSGTGLSWQAAGSLFQPGVMIALIVATPLVAAMAALPPALWAARMDPAVVLQEE